MAAGPIPDFVISGSWVAVGPILVFVTSGCWVAAGFSSIHIDRRTLVFLLLNIEYRELLYLSVKPIQTLNAKHYFSFSNLSIFAFSLTPIDAVEIRFQDNVREIDNMFSPDHTLLFDYLIESGIMQISIIISMANHFLTSWLTKEYIYARKLFIKFVYPTESMITMNFSNE